MQVTTLKLTELFPALSGYGEATLTTYLPNTPQGLNIAARPSILVLPGGGYRDVSAREAEPVALAYTAKGYNAFVLDYSVAPFSYPAQLLQVTASIKHIRDNAAEYKSIPDKIAVIGFSAGGHLAGSSATLYNDPVVLAALECEASALRPDAAILSYPVITGGEYAHRGSFVNLTAGGNQSLTDYLSLENHIDANTPPCFLWHTADDGGVPVQNTLLFAQGLARCKVPFETHIYMSGPHGISLADDTTSVGRAELNNSRTASWLNLSAQWLDQLGFKIAHNK